MSNLAKHVPVMQNESLNALKIQKAGIYVDATFGFGGHSQAILSKLDEEGRLYAIDKDTSAIELADKRIIKDERFTLKQGCFSSLESFSKEWGIQGSVNGILFDLGVSSEHLENPKRGFSFLREGPIDMRFDQSSGNSAGDWLASVSENTLAKIIKEYGDERYAKRIAKGIVTERVKERINTTKDLVNIINKAIPKNETKKHNATRTFQAIRIHINQELETLKKSLEKTYNILAPKGRLVLITYHSLEERIIKDFITLTDKSLSAPKDLPLTEQFLTKMFKIINKPLKPTDEEIEINKKSRSAKLNVLEKYNENNS